MEHDAPIVTLPRAEKEDPACSCPVAEIAEDNVTPADAETVEPKLDRFATLKEPFSPRSSPVVVPVIVWLPSIIMSPPTDIGPASEQPPVNADNDTGLMNTDRPKTDTREPHINEPLTDRPEPKLENPVAEQPCPVNNRFPADRSDPT
jgi:hypothetical protein